VEQMKKYQVIMTRDITESRIVTVRANSEEEASEYAYDAVLDYTNEDDAQIVKLSKWQTDDCSCGTSSPYETGIEEVKEDG
jgi:hypothetical protein